MNNDELNKYKRLLDQVDKLMNVSVGFIGLCIIPKDKLQEASELQERMSEIVSKIESIL